MRIVLKTGGGLAALALSVAACTSGQPEVSGQGRDMPAGQYATSGSSSAPSTDGSTDRPVKCAPPQPSAEIAAGPPGNEWLRPVNTGQKTVVDASVDVRESAHIEELRFEIQPAGVPGPAANSRDSAGSPVVWWTVAGEGLSAGSYDFDVSWDGTNQTGDPVPSGRYQLFAQVTARNLDATTGPCSSVPGAVSSEGAGLGYFDVEP